MCQDIFEEAVEKAVDEHMPSSPLYDSVLEMADSVTTTSDEGSSTMTPESMDDEAGIRSTIQDPFNRVLGFDSNSLMIFDYDDTLFPTSFLAQQGYRLDGLNASPDIQNLLNDLSEVVSKVLCHARSYGVVVIVTNAESGWIELTSKKFMPKLFDLLGDFRLVSARSAYEPLGISSPFQWKVQAFEAVLSEHLILEPESRSVLSFGDSTHERDAAHSVCAKVNIYCKSVKFMERPDIHQLSRQHSLIHDCFKQIIGHSGSLDLCIQCRNQEEPRVHSEFPGRGKIPGSTTIL